MDVNKNLFSSYRIENISILFLFLDEIINRLIFCKFDLRSLRLNMYNYLCWIMLSRNFKDIITFFTRIHIISFYLSQNLFTFNFILSQLLHTIIKFLLTQYKIINREPILPHNLNLILPICRNIVYLIRISLKSKKLKSINR